MPLTTKKPGEQRPISQQAAQRAPHPALQSGLPTTDSKLAQAAVSRVSTEFRRHGIPRNFLTSEVISAQFRRNSAKFRGIPRNFAGIAPEITSVFRGMPKCHFRGHPSCISPGAGGRGHREHTERQRSLSGVHSIMMQKSWKK